MGGDGFSRKLLRDACVLAGAFANRVSSALGKAMESGTAVTKRNGVSWGLPSSTAARSRAFVSLAPWKIARRLGLLDLDHE